MGDYKDESDDEDDDEDASNEDEGRWHWQPA
jgi:hypothetical protein